MTYRTGIGYDIHRFKKGRKLFLGGVEIPYDNGLDGYSDADVLLHAVCDALLGAVGKGDIGEHFPPSDEKYRGISSLLLLDEVREIVVNEGFRIENLDTVVIAEEPHLKDHKEAIRKSISGALSIDESAVNIKAATQEGLGPVGQKLGISAWAAVLLKKQ